ALYTEHPLSGCERLPSLAEDDFRSRSTGAGSFFLGHGNTESGFETGKALADLVQCAVVEHLHPLLAGSLAELVERHALLDELGEPGGDADDLEDAQAAPVTQPSALKTTLGAIKDFA